MKTNNLATLKERLISAWCCLTYTEFFMCAANTDREEGKVVSAKCYYSTLDTKENHPFVDAVHKISDDTGEYTFMKTMNV